MAAKRPNGETFGEAPLEKCGRLEESDVENADAELDDEVEKELREFERLQSGLLGTTFEQENGKNGVGNGSHIVQTDSMEQENASGSDMKRNNLKQEIAEARKKNTSVQHQAVKKAPKRSKRLVSDETLPLKNIRILPDTFAEENLRGDDLVEKSGIPEDGEEACLDIERAVRILKHPKAVDPLLPPDTEFNHQSSMKLQGVNPIYQNSTSKPEQSEAELSPPKVNSAGRENLNSQSPKPDFDDDSGDPDFPSPAKRKSRRRVQTIRSKAPRSELGRNPPKKQRISKEFETPKSTGPGPENDFQGTALQNDEETSIPPMPPLTRIQPTGGSQTPPTQQVGNRHPQIPQSSERNHILQDPVSQRPLQTTAQSESEKIREIYPSLPETDPFRAAPFMPKEALVDPVLKIRVQPKSLHQDPGFKDQILGQVSKPLAHQIDTASPERSQSREVQIHERIIQGGQADEGKITEKTPALGQHHVRALNFDQTVTQSNPIVQHTLPILTNSYKPEAVESPLLQHKPEAVESPLLQPKSSLQVGLKQDEPQIAPSPRPNNPKPPKHPAYLDFLRNSKNLANPAPRPEEQDRKKQAPSPGNRSDNSQPTTVTIDITYDQPAQYCVIERIIQRKFENSFLLEDENFDMMGADRPKICCPELYPYMTLYENQIFLAACNELKKFFCWPCLFFTSKVIWSVNRDENSEIALVKEINKHKKSPVHQESIKQLNALMLKNKSSIINSLLGNNFVDGTWTDQDQEAIIMKGRPRPTLSYQLLAEENVKTYKKVAYEEFYDQFKWMCGCTVSRKFYCWPCLLFSREKWAHAANIQSAEATASQHETTRLHMDACLKLGKWEFDLRKKTEAKNEENEKTCSFLKCLVEIICAEKKKINNAEFSSMDFVDSVELMGKYNGQLRFFIDEKLEHSKITIAQILPLYTTAILESVECFIKRGILEEIKSSNFISLIFDHSSGLSNKAILSVIARYVDANGQVRERFVKLLNVGYNTPSNMLFDEFFQIITELQCRSTLFGFTYDGYLMKPGNIPDFNSKVQKLCPNAKFFHYAEHSFKRVLKQTLCHVPICRRVLQAVKELASFFDNTPSARKGLSDMVAAAEKSHCEDVWRSANFITTVFLYHKAIVEIMESICQNARDWKVKTVVQASNFLDFFKDAKNRFFVTLMARIFNAVEDLTNELNQDVAIEDLKTIANHAALEIQKLGRNFDTVVNSACSHLEVSDQENTRKEMSALDEQFSNIVQLVVKLVKNRIFGLESGYFKMSKEVPTSSFTHFITLKRPNLVLQNVALPSYFSSTKLSNEIQFFHGASMLFGHDLPEIIAHMNNYNMIKALPELFKFLQLALTVPQKQCDTSTIPAVHRIAAYIEGKKDLNSTDALIWMEKEFLSNLQKEPNFYQKVADRVMLITKKDILNTLQPKSNS